MFYSELVPISKFLHSYPLKKLTFMLKKQTIWKQERKIASSFLRSFFCLKPGPYQPRKHKHKRSLCASEDGHDINIRIAKPCVLLMLMFMSPQCPVSRGRVGISISARLSPNWRRLMLMSTMFSLNISIRKLMLMSQLSSLEHKLLMLLFMLMLASQVRTRLQE